MISCCGEEGGGDWGGFAYKMGAKAEIRRARMAIFVGDEGG